MSGPECEAKPARLTLHWPPKMLLLLPAPLPLPAGLPPAGQGREPCGSSAQESRALHLKGPNKKAAWASVRPLPDPRQNGPLHTQPAAGTPSLATPPGERRCQRVMCTCRRRLVQSSKGAAMGGSRHPQSRGSVVRQVSHRH